MPALAQEHIVLLHQHGSAFCEKYDVGEHMFPPHFRRDDNDGSSELTMIDDAYFAYYLLRYA